jgi:hypothetical protein
MTLSRNISTSVEIKCQLDATDKLLFQNLLLLNMFRAKLCPSSGSRECYTSDWCLLYLVLGYQVVGIVWRWGLCVWFGGCSPQNIWITNALFMKGTTNISSIIRQEQRRKWQHSDEKNSKIKKLLFHKKQFFCFIMSLYGVSNIPEHVCTEGIWM